MVSGFIGAISKKIEQWTGLDVDYYVKNNLYLIIVQAVILLSGLATSVVLTRMLTREAYGQYNYIFSIIGILAIFSLPGMGTAIAHAVSNNHDRVLITGTRIRVKWSLIGAAVCLGVGLYYYLKGEPLLGVSLMLATLFYPFYTSFDNYYPFLYGRKQFGKASQYRSVYWIVLTIAIVIAVYLTGNLLWVVVVYLATATAVEAFFLFHTVRTGNLNRGEDRAAITYGKQLTGIQAISLMALQADRLFVGLALGYTELAFYSLAVMISALPSVLLGSVSTTIFPKIAAMEERTAYNEVKRRLPWLFIAMVFICGIGALLCPYVIPWLYSTKYVSSVLYTQLLFIPVILGTPASVLRRGTLQAQRKTRELFKLNMAVSLFELAALVVLALKLGIIGIVIARSLARIFDSAYSWRLTR